jgi:hypothetical protein
MVRPSEPAFASVRPSGPALPTPVATALAVAILAFVAFVAFVPSALAASEEGVPRTLDEILIEGEVAMPQVLFITAREPYRFADTAHRLYLVDSEDVRAFISYPFPLWIGRTLAPSVSTVRWNDAAAPSREEAGPVSPDGSQGRN